MPYDQPETLGAELRRRQLAALEHAGDPDWPSAHRYGGETGAFTACLKVVLEPWPIWMVSVWCRYPGTEQAWLTYDWTPERLVIAAMVAEAELTGVGRDDAGLERVTPVEVIHTRPPALGPRIRPPSGPLGPQRDG